MGIDFMVVGLILGCLIGRVGLIRFFIHLLVGVLGFIEHAELGFIGLAGVCLIVSIYRVCVVDFGGFVDAFRFVIVCFCVFVLVLGVLVSDMLDVGHTNAHGRKGENTNGKENAADEHGAHPDAVFNVGFATAHSSAPFGSAAHNLSFSEGPSCLWWPNSSFLSS